MNTPKLIHIFKPGRHVAMAVEGDDADGALLAFVVGQALGREQPREARFVAGVGMGTALVWAAISASLILLLRQQIATVYTADPLVIEVATMLLMFAALYQFSDVIQVTAAGALRGYQDTRVTMILTGKPGRMVSVGATCNWRWTICWPA